MYAIQVKEQEAWQTVTHADGTPVVLFEGQTIPQLDAEVRCVPLEHADESI
jgi:hypothetical protein